jgi:hypothetical protein
MWAKHTTPIVVTVVGPRPERQQCGMVFLVCYSIGVIEAHYDYVFVTV